jgi:hypothetical protein
MAVRLPDKGCAALRDQTTQGGTDMAHGYLGDGYGIHGDSDERGDHRERSSRDSDWRERDRDWRDRDRGMMFGSRDNDWSHDDRFSRREWFGGGRDFGSRGDYRDEGRTYSAHPDDHYRSWRDRHMSELDRDYQDYCREREQAFHQEFDQWRNQRHGNPQPLRTGMTQSGIDHDPSGELQLETEATPDQSGTDPMGEATLGTNSSAGTGRRR